MKELILERLKANQDSVKIEEKPKEGKTFTELVAETGLSQSECDCIVQQLIKEGKLEAVSYVSGVTACGGAIKSTVFVEKSAPIKK